MLATLHHMQMNLPPLPPPSEGAEGVSSVTSPTMRQLGTLTQKHIWHNDFPETGIEVYRSHNTLVHRLAKEQGREVLEYTPGEGWERLRLFLGKEIPMDEETGEILEFPRQDDWVKYKREHGTA